EALIPQEEWDLYRSVIDKLREKGIRFAVGGGLAFSEYSCRVRNTKDLDLYIFPWDRNAAAAAVLEAGFEDYHEKAEYDRSWIFRGYKEPVIVDLIWTAPNHRMVVDARWLTRGRDVVIRGTRLKLIPPEELIWAKMYVLQRDRCDWPDVLNILYNMGHLLDWRHLLNRAGKDVPLLGGVLSAYRWLAPERASNLPAWLWEQAGLSKDWMETSAEVSAERGPILDYRDWFGPKETFEEAK
ncbi:MAG: hypothetical protein QOJ65_1567, partial [Fimbriimonadaceae bacterium]|nr:hypothetical protein [Fimbriimonadaceae bacterium]